MKKIRILAIESSCDETAIAIYCSEKGLISNLIYSQIKLHQVYGGVVPEIASRNHLTKITHLVEKSLLEAKIGLKEITHFAYTQGPGLAGSLLIGASFAKSLAVFNRTPILPIHHMEGHLVAPMLENSSLNFPFLTLLISGGHSMLVVAKKMGDYQILGESRDDALGEAFDKVAKMMGLGYPGGAKLSKLASECKKSKYTFPRPMINHDSLDFSFSGLKTHALQTYEMSKKTKSEKIQIARAFEEAIIDVIIAKTTKAMELTGLNKLVVSGGVSANLPLRNALTHKFGSQFVYFPRLSLCGDNAAMIAYAAYLRLKEFKNYAFEEDKKINIQPRWSIEDID